MASSAVQYLYIIWNVTYMYHWTNRVRSEMHRHYSAMNAQKLKFSHEVCWDLRKREREQNRIVDYIIIIHIHYTCEQ